MGWLVSRIACVEVRDCRPGIVLSRLFHTIVDAVWRADAGPRGGTPTLSCTLGDYGVELGQVSSRQTTPPINSR